MVVGAASSSFFCDVDSAGADASGPSGPSSGLGGGVSRALAADWRLSAATATGRLMLDTIDAARTRADDVSAAAGVATDGGPSPARLRSTACLALDAMAGCAPAFRSAVWAPECGV